MKTDAYRIVAGLAAICSALAAPSLAAPLSANDGDQPTAEDIAEAGELFDNSCASCHLPPDSDYVTDRAWLSQVNDTA